MPHASPPSHVEHALGRSGPWLGPWHGAESGGDAVTAAVLLLHGGQVSSTDATAARLLSVRRMVPFATALERRYAGSGLAVLRLRNRVRGWNGDGSSALADAGSALAEIGRRLGPVPVVLIGHSLGGRVALRTGGHPAVRGVPALAPWLPDGEPVAQLAGRRVHIAHGTRDMTTSARASRRHAARLAGVARTSDFTPVRFDTHPMLRWRVWNRLVTDVTGEVLGPGDTRSGRR